MCQYGRLRWQRQVSTISSSPSPSHLLKTPRYPNPLSYRLLQNLATISGSYSHIWFGEMPLYNATQTIGVINDFITPGADQPDKVAIGPSWYQSFMTFLARTRYVYQVNYMENSSLGVENTIADT
jgi:hypothetical protein